MKKMLFILLLLILSVWIGLEMQSLPGLVVITFGHYKIQASLWITLLAAVLATWLLLVAVRMLRFAFGFIPHVGQWMDTRQQTHAHEQSLEGLRALLEGEWARAEKLLTRATKHGDMVDINWMGAAVAAHQQNDLTARDRLLGKFKTAHKGNCFLGALLKYQSGEPEAALAEVHDYLSEHQRNANGAWYHLKLDCLRTVGDWEAVHDLLPKLKQHSDLPKDALEGLRLETTYHLMQHYDHNDNHAGLEALWQSLPSALQQTPLLLSRFAEYCLKTDQQSLIAPLLLKSLKKSTNPDLLDVFGQLNSSDDNASYIKHALNWLKQDKDNADILRCLARLHAHANLLEQAQHYYERCLNYQADILTHLELAKVYQALNRKEDALKAYQTGSMLLTT